MDAESIAAGDPDARLTAGPDDAERYAARVLRSFVRDGRLTSIPAKNRKREIILRWLVDTCFPAETTYSERDINMRLALIHQDVAALRRYLVEAGLMTRAAGEYRRTPGPTRPPAPSDDPGATGSGAS